MVTLKVVCWKSTNLVEVHLGGLKKLVADRVGSDDIERGVLIEGAVFNLLLSI